jgi:hypothetical protein
MLHRITVLLIIGFWLAMTALLVVREMYPEATRLNEIPLAHVARVMFQHEQSSDLVIKDKQREVGYFHVQPRVRRDTGARHVDFHGNLSVLVPGAGRKRISWSGSNELDAALSTRVLRLTLATLDPVHELNLTVDVPRNIAHYSLSAQTVELERGSFTLDKKGMVSLLERAGLPVAIFESILSQQASMAPPEITARQSTLKMNGETVSTFLVTASVGGQVILEGHVTQLGQLIKAHSVNLGYKLYPYNSKESD